MIRGLRTRPLALGVAVIVCAAAGIAVWRATSSGGGSDRAAHAEATVAAADCTSARATARSRAALLAAEARYQLEANGPTTHRDLLEVANDPQLLQALAASDLALALQAANRQLVRHVVRIRVMRGSRVLVDANPTSFDVAGIEMALPGGGPLRGERVRITLQDVIGFNKLVHRLIHAEAVVRSSGGQMRTTLAAAARMQLPARGCVRLAARRYAVASFGRRSFTDEHLSIWILTPA